MSGRHRGWDCDTDEPVFVFAVSTLDASYEDDLVRARWAVAVAQRGALLRRSDHDPNLRQLIDFSETLVDDGVGQAYYLFRSVWEWGTHTLLEELAKPTADRELLDYTIEYGIGYAIYVLQQAGLVHCDVAPNNILEVNGTWVLADLDHARPIGEPTTGRPKDPAFLVPGERPGDLASSQMDQAGLLGVLRAIGFRTP